MYARNTGEVFSRGFDGTTEYGQVGWVSPAYEKLFIARTNTNTFEAGYYEGGVRTVLVTRTPTVANAAAYVGFYADVRAVGVLGDLDNLGKTSALWVPHNPGPANGNPAAGTALGDGTVDVILGWAAGLDPTNESQVNPIITKELVFLSNNPADPNLYYLGTIPQTGILNPSYPLSGLVEVTDYRW